MKKASFLGILTVASAISTLPVQANSTWTGTNQSNGNWSSVTAPGWTSGGVPNAIGAIGIFTGNGTRTVTQDIAEGVTVGSLIRDGSGSNNGTWIISGPNAITLNQDGAGAGHASLINSTVSTTAPKLQIDASANLILADDLLIANTGSSNSVSVEVAGVLSGVGNVTISSTQNTATAGQISLSGANTFTGSVTVAKGAVQFNKATSFGNVANVVTLGASGSGGVTALANASNFTVANNIVVAANTLGTTILGSSATANNSDNTFSGQIRLDGNLTVTDSHTGTRGTILSGVVSGVGGLTVSGTGRVSLTNVNTYTGNTTVEALSTLNLADSSSISFVIKADGVNNQLNGSGNVVLAGDFAFDLTGAAAAGSWTIVDVASLNTTFAPTFSVTGFVDNGNDTWSYGSYTFSETTGVLSAVPEPTVSLLLLGGATAVLAGRRRRK